jgi:hypothetical protein
MSEVYVNTRFYLQRACGSCIVAMSHALAQPQLVQRRAQAALAQQRAHVRAYRTNAYTRAHLQQAAPLRTSMTPFNTMPSARQQSVPLPATTTKEQQQNSGESLKR